MNKRPYPASLSPDLLDNALHDLSPDPDQTGSAAAKKPRNFIATVACENCRLKKTRCDESRPKCGLCKSLGLDCVYNERKTSKRDHSLSLIMSTLHRLETKLEGVPTAISNEIQSLRSQMPHGLNTPDVTSSHARRHRSISRLGMQDYFSSQNPTPEATRLDDLVEHDEQESRPNPADSKGLASISFSQHGVISWLGVQELLPQRLLEAHDQLGKNYVIDLEMNRPQLPMYICPFPAQAGSNWLETLPLAMVKGLSDVFFTTFNPFTPIIDRNFYFALTLGAAIESNFGYTIESCVVLNIMALGCIAVHAYQEGNYPLPGTRSDRFEPPEWMGVVYEETPGLRFFNEARQRIGFLMCDNDVQSCQFYLLSFVYYSQILRPMDSWAMIHRAATCCLSMLTNRDVHFDEWEGDMKSRVYWNCLMNETILVQELHVPPSGLARLEEYVPIPKFISFEFAASRSISLEEIDDSFFQYHFLAQVAHRIILTRIRHSLYFHSDSGTFPHPAVNAELRHQLEQWRINLPAALQFSDSPPPTSTTDINNTNTNTTTTDTSASPSPAARLPFDPTRHPLSPAIAVSEAMLRGRYMIANFHIGRPYLYKALHIPASLTDNDLDQIRRGLLNAMNWPIVLGIFRRMKSCIPLKFAFCSQFFGQILLFYCISHSPDARLQETLPAGWEQWNQEMLRFLEDCAQFSPAVAKDLELLQSL
ncbi:C6 finger domain protein [Aspergillus heteromorphus CBS 117.55]|uniref:C6 finger domain protein n=1 Tax=Aspergillus heteromorphus CBS 117.55 TaxID=1448321 RepID=A0A317VZZ3_9EURO|nr:C6 finger domain protein [Aspergillus heteromorphus CBS 117.55]PWY79219.1 C6 finger domain protein [Aspergillus heteromorphus CBS 117.55]